MSLFYAVGIMILGHDANRPKRRALGIVSLLLSGAVGCGWLLQQGVNNFALPAVDKPLLFFACTFVVSLSIFVSMLMSHTNLRPKDTFSKLLWYLPLHALRRWFYTQAPLYFTGLITLVTILPSLHIIAHNLGLSNAAFFASTVLGIAGTYGLFYACCFATPSLYLICLTASIAVEFYCLRQLASSPHPFAWKVILGILCTIKCFGWLSCRRLAEVQYVPRKATRMLGSHLQAPFWYIKKVLRASLLNIGLCFMICLGIAIYYWRLEIKDAHMLASIAALIMASLASDIRGLCRAHLPAEVATLRGVRYFTAHHFGATLLACLSVLPLIALLIAERGPVFCYLQLLLGIAAGCFAGASLVPRTRDISSQCLAVLLGIVLVIVPSRFASLADHTLFILGEIGVLTLSTFVIEYLRNPFIWRKL